MGRLSLDICAITFFIKFWAYSALNFSSVKPNLLKAQNYGLISLNTSMFTKANLQFVYINCDANLKCLLKYSHFYSSMFQ